MVTDAGDSTQPPPHQKLARFLDGLPPCAPFTHRDHVEVAWLLLATLPLERAIGVFCDRLRAIAALAGVPEKFHATMTWSYLALVDERRRADESFDAFALRNADLLDPTHPTLERHYSKERLAAPDARRRFVFPDRVPHVSH